MEIKTIRTHILKENCYIIHNNKECLLVDPGSDLDIDIKKIKEEIGNMKLQAIICTHNHFDHIGAIHCFDVPIYMHDADIKTIDTQKVLSEFVIQRKLIIPKVIIPFKESMKIAPFKFKVIHTPGHTKGCVCFLFDKFIITGDTLFKGTLGRTDLPGSNYEEIVKSLKLLSSLNSNLDVYPGHGSKTRIIDEKEWILRLK